MKNRMKLIQSNITGKLIWKLPKRCENNSEQPLKEDYLFQFYSHQLPNSPRRRFSVVGGFPQCWILLLIHTYTNPYLLGLDEHFFPGYPAAWSHCYDYNWFAGLTYRFSLLDIVARSDTPYQHQWKCSPTQTGWLLLDRPYYWIRGFADGHGFICNGIPTSGKPDFRFKNRL